jgi:hypothetical protein
MSELRKYATGTGADIVIPMVKVGGSDFALGPDWTPAVGDIKVSKDNGTAANIATLPVFITDVGWKFVFSNAELTAARININIADSAPKAIEDQHIIINTYGNTLAQHAFDLDTAEQSVDMVKISGDSTAADNLELDYDGTGYDKSNSTIGTCTTNTDMVTLADLFTTQMVESYAADGVAPTMAQALFLVQQRATEFAIISSALTIKKLDGTTTAAVLTLNDDTAPTSATRSA